MRIARYGLDGKKTVTEVPPYETDFVYLHLKMTDGDGMYPLGITKSGADDKLSVVGTFRAGFAPDSDVLPIGTAESPVIFRVNLRNDQNQIKDIIKTSFVDGVFSVDYTADVVPVGIYHLSQDDLTSMVNDKPIVLVGDTEFKVYRDPSQVV